MDEDDNDIWWWHDDDDDDMIMMMTAKSSSKCLKNLVCKISTLLLKKSNFTNIGFVSSRSIQALSLQPETLCYVGNIFPLLMPWQSGTLFIWSNFNHSKWAEFTYPFGNILAPTDALTDWDPFIDME